MTISTTLARKDYVGNGSLAAYPYPFRILASSDLLVYVSGALKTLGVHYSVSGVGADGGGNVTFVTAHIPASDAPIALLRNTSATQGTDLDAGRAFYEQDIEAMVDKVTMLVQEFYEKLDRTPRLPATSPLKNVQFPVPGALGYLRWNLSGTGLEAMPMAGVPSTAAEDIVGIFPDIIAMGPCVDVRAYGAVADAPDSTAGLAAAWAAAAALGRPIFIPAGIFTTTEELLWDVATSGPLTIGGYGGRSILKSIGATNKVLKVSGTRGVTSGPVIIDKVKLQSGTSGTADALLHIDGIAIFSLLDLRLEGNSKTTNGVLLTATQQGRIAGGLNHASSTGIRLECADGNDEGSPGSIGSNGVEIHGVSLMSDAINVDYAGVATGFIHSCHLEVAPIGIIVSGVQPLASAQIIAAFNHIEGFTTGIKNHFDQSLQAIGNTFIGATGATDLDFDGPKGSLIEGNLLNGHVTFGYSSGQLTFANNISVGASIGPSGAVFTNNSTAFTYYGNKTVGYGFSLPGSKFRGNFVIQSVGGVDIYEFVAGGNFKILGNGMGIEMKNAAGTIAKIVRLNDAGDGLVFEAV